MIPTIVYKKGGLNRGPKGVPYSYKGVDSEDVFNTLLADGWYETLDEALGKKKEVVEKKPIPVDAPKIDLSFKKPEKSLDDGEDFRRYEEFTEIERKEIYEKLKTGNEKQIRDEYNLHHTTVKKIKNALD